MGILPMSDHGLEARATSKVHHREHRGSRRNPVFFSVSLCVLCGELLHLLADQKRRGPPRRWSALLPVSGLQLFHDAMRLIDVRDDAALETLSLRIVLLRTGVSMC